MRLKRASWINKKGGKIKSKTTNADPEEVSNLLKATYFSQRKDKKTEQAYNSFVRTGLFYFKRLLSEDYVGTDIAFQI
ncbi:hypothetical protein QTP70_016002 [Hemibagrus guttatus]|uniref:Uncharacterized protein n=1 Tax=Hemibagrus guttatus TaxID=175788 RepID=A0AAE0QN98_9TELE|nr:hypothetical protein QTP70_016002 [Hemibagrus guttatus]